MTEKTQPLELTLSPQHIALIRKTKARDCTDNEFEQFIHICSQRRLDPMQNQIYAQVYNKNDPSKRNMTIIVSIDGLRAIADATGNYAPDDEAPRYNFDASLIDPTTNPEGVISAYVSVFKQVHGQMRRCVGEARWNFYAPMKAEWKKDENGYNVKTGRFFLDPRASDFWLRGGPQMLAKCAEAAALRRAFPAQLAQLYTPEEMAQARAREHEDDGREAKKRTSPETHQPQPRPILIDWLGGKGRQQWTGTPDALLEQIHTASLRAMAAGDVSSVAKFRAANAAELRRMSKSATADQRAALIKISALFSRADEAVSAERQKEEGCND